MEFVVLTIDEPPFTTNQPIAIGNGKLVLKTPAVKTYPIEKVLGIVVPELS